MFPKLTSIDKVILFGSTLEESDIDLLLFYNNREQYQYDMSITLLDEFPDSCYDDTIRISGDAYGVLNEALQKGVIVYARQSRDTSLLSYIH